MLTLGNVGYVAHTEQTAVTLHTLRILMSLAPATFALLTALLTVFYPINKAMEQELQAALGKKD